MKTHVLTVIKSTPKLVIFCLIGLAFLISGCEKQSDEIAPQITPDQISVDDARKNLPHKEIAMLRATVARYHNIKHAIADGYDTEFTGYRSQMGYHYLKPELLDYTFELTKPEVLVYAPAPNGKLRLVAVEYATIVDDLQNPPPAPEGFTGTADSWALNTEFSVWTLHVWVGLNNPNGIFAPRNPRLP